MQHISKAHFSDYGNYANQKPWTDALEYSEYHTATDQ